MKEPTVQFQSEFNTYITPDGVEFVLQDYGIRAIMSIDGEGAPPVDYTSQKGIFQDGETLQAATLTPRIVSLEFYRSGYDDDDYQQARSNLIDVMRHNRGSGATISRGRLRRYYKDGQIRDLFCLPEKGPNLDREFQKGNRFNVLDKIKMIAHDPTYWDGLQTTVNIDLGTADDNMAIPMNIPLYIGGSQVNVSPNVNYSGTYHTFPTFTLTGPMNRFYAKNVATGDYIDFRYQIPVGKSVTINLEYGQKTAIDSDGIHRLGSITRDSSPESLSIVPHARAINGVNQFNFIVTGINVANGSTAQMKYYRRFTGI